MKTYFYKVLYKDKEVVYVGVTTRTITDRFKEHIISKSLNLESYSVMEFDCIEHPEINSIEIFREEWKRVAELERKYIKEELDKGSHLLNLSKGGEWGANILKKLREEDFMNKFGSYDGYKEYRRKREKSRALIWSWILCESENKTKKLVKSWVQHRSESKTRVLIQSWIQCRSGNKTRRLIKSWIQCRSENRTKKLIKNWILHKSYNKTKLLIINWIQCRSENRTKRLIKSWIQCRSGNKTKKLIKRWISDKTRNKTKVLVTSWIFHRSMNRTKTIIWRWMAHRKV